MKNLIKKSLLATVVLSSVSVSAMAAKLIVCVPEAPTWAQITDGRVGAQSTGPAIIVDLEGKSVAWVGTGGYVRLTGVEVADGTMFTLIEGSNPQTEKILDLKESTMILESLPPQYGSRYNIVLADSWGGEGNLQITLSGRKMSGPKTGGGNWSDKSGSKERFNFCTTLVKGN